MKSALRRFCDGSITILWQIPAIVATMFSVELTAKQVLARRGYIVVWEVSRVTFQLKAPEDTATETVLRTISLQKSAEKLFGGFGQRGARIEFTILGLVSRIIPID